MRREREMLGDSTNTESASMRYRSLQNTFPSHRHQRETTRALRASPSQTIQSPTRLTTTDPQVKTTGDRGKREVGLKERDAADEAREKERKEIEAREKAAAELERQMMERVERKILEKERLEKERREMDRMEKRIREKEVLEKRRLANEIREQKLREQEAAERRRLEHERKEREQAQQNQRNREQYFADVVSAAQAPFDPNWSSPYQNPPLPVYHRRPKIKMDAEDFVGEDDYNFY